MAEINIEKKKKPVWPWILFFLVLIALLVWIFSEDSDDDRYEDQTTETEQVEERRSRQPADEQNNNAMANERQNQQQQGAVAEYRAFVQSKGDSMGLQHRYTHQGLSLMAEALSALSQKAQADIKVQEDVEAIKAQADRLLKNTYAEYHADTIRGAFMNVAMAMEDILNQAQLPQMPQTATLKQEAKKISGKELALEQKQAVNNFFKQSAQLMQKIENKLSA